jgi:hypothetical protein
MKARRETGMRKALLAAVLATLASVTACGKHDAAQQASSNATAEEDTGNEEADNGQTGSFGPDDGFCFNGRDCTRSTCEMDADCTYPGLAEDFARALGEPRASPLEIATPLCEHVSRVSNDALRVSGPVCHCSAYQIGPIGLGCFLFGRDQSCLWDDSEFAGCDPEVASSCHSTCDELEQRLADDAARQIDVTLFGTPCVDGLCKLVMSVEGRCFVYPDTDPSLGRGYDCGLGDRGVIDAARAEAETPKFSPEPIPDFNGPELSAAGTDGAVRLSVRKFTQSSERLEDNFGAFLQWFDGSIPSVWGGKVVDPLMGTGDCGVFIPTGTPISRGFGFPSQPDWTLIDGETQHGVMGSIDLGALGLAPRFGGSYGIITSDPQTQQELTLTGLVLPPDLVINELDQTDRLAHGALHFTWTGQGDEPLSIAMQTTPGVATRGLEYQLHCLVPDTGAFTIPAEAIALIPPAQMYAEFRRELRTPVESGGTSVLFVGTVWSNYGFELTPSP